MWRHAESWRRPRCLWTQPEQRLGGGPGLVEAGAAGDDLSGLDFSPQGEGILVLLMRAGRKRTEESLARLVVVPEHPQCRQNLLHLDGL